MNEDVMSVQEVLPDYGFVAGYPAVPVGYKQTELGLIPEDWGISSVGDQFTIQLGKMLDSERNTGEPKPYLGNRAVQWDRIDITDLATVPMTKADLNKYRLDEGDILVCEGGEVGRAAIWNAQIDECYFQKALHRLKPVKQYNNKLMVAVLRRWADKGILKNYVTQTSIAHLPRDKFLTIPIPVPPNEEQHAIATVLSDVDALLEELDRLIAKKRDIKQAAMQQLLTGETRLPGFEGEWKKSKLGDYVIFLRNGTNSRAELQNSSSGQSVRYLHYGDIHACKASHLSPSGLPFLPSNKATTLGRLENGDLVFADASEDLEGVGKSVEILNVDTSEVVAGLHTIAARFSKGLFAVGFKAYLQYCPKFISPLRRLAAGTKVYATTRKHISSIEMQLPGLNEQTAIAHIFQDIDTEIQALEQRRSKTAELKKGMMQELLTGRTRLV